MRSTTIAGLLVLTGACSASACTQLLGGFDFNAKGAGGGGAAGSGGGASSSTTTSTGGATTVSSSSSTTSGSSSGGGGTCTGGLSQCSGTCVDLSTDAHDCGRCGHDCLYGACSASKCRAWTVVPSADVGGQMDADGAYVVWGDSVRGVHQVKVSGGAVTTLSATVGPQTGSGPLLRNGRVVFSNGNTIDTAAEGATSLIAPATLPGAPYTVSYLAVNSTATNAFFLGQTGNTGFPYYLLQCPLSFTTCYPLGSAIETPGYNTAPATTQLLVNDTYAFWFYRAVTTASIARYTFATTAITSVTTNLMTTNLMLDAGNVYWVGTPSYTIYAMPLSFTATTTPLTVATSAGVPAGLASDGANVYFGTHTVGSAATLSYAPAGGGSLTVMYTSPNASSSNEGPVVAAGGAVYWADGNTDNCPVTYSIMGIAAP